MFGMSPNFNEPQSNDPTSAPPMNDPTSSSVQPMQNPVAQILAKKKKSSVRNPGALAGAIARAKKARQSGQKWG